MMDNYLQILEESLHKKAEVLKQIRNMEVKQEYLLKSPDITEAELDGSLDLKGQLTEQLTLLDQGFEQLYDHVRLQLQQDKEKYRQQITKLQQLITEVTDLTVEVQAQEIRNNKLAKTFFKQSKKSVKDSRMNSKAAYGYYQNMSGAQTATPQFMDQKK